MKKILVIEDNLEMRENITEMLELSHYTIFAAENGKKGIELAQKEIPDMIICDIMMPEMDGYGVLYLLSKNPSTAGIPFIFLTAKAEKSDVRKGMNLGADDYITKPFEEMELLNAIDMRLKRSEIIRKDFEKNIDGLDKFLDEARGMEKLNKLTIDRRVQKYHPKDTIFHDGDFANRLYFINRGKVKTWKMTDTGKELVTGIYKEGEFLGYLSLLESEEYSETASALEESEIVIIPKEDFLTLLHSNRDVSIKFIKMLSNNIVETEKRLLKLAYGTLRERTAEALLFLKKKYSEKEGDNSFKLSREDLASLVGTATESLIRTLSDFKDEKLIEIKGREIKILNDKGLEKVMQFSFYKGN